MSDSGSRTVVLTALAGNAAIALSKYGAALLTGSAAMLAEAIHSSIDTGNQGLMLLGMARARKPPDSDRPFGYGNEVYFWSFMVAVLLFTVGSGLSIADGIDHLLNPAPVSDPWVNYGVLALGFVFEGTSWFVAAREFNRIKGRWGVFEAIHRGKDPNKFLVLFEDTAALAGLALALAGLIAAQLTGNEIFDALASIGIGVILALVSIGLAVETRSLLIGESANPQVVDAIREVLNAEAAVARVNEIATLHFGPEFVLATISVRFRAGLSGRELQNAIERMDRQIKARYALVQRIFIEAEYEADTVPVDPE